MFSETDNQPKLKLGRNCKLLKTTDVQNVFNNARLRVGLDHMLILALDNKLPHSRIGVIAPKKAVPHAHQRNQIKRIIRESFRLNQHAIVNPHHATGLDIICLAKKGITTYSKKQLAISIGNGWEKLHGFAQKFLNTSPKHD